MKKITNKIKNIIKYIKDNKNEILDFIKKHLYIIIMAIPFFILDIFTRFFGRKVNFFGLFELVPNLFTTIWIMLVLGISLSFKGKKRKRLYILFLIIAIIFFIVNNIYYSVSNTFFDFSLLGLASEGSSYMLDSIVNADISIYITLFITIILSIIIVKKMPTRNNNNYKIGISCFLVFVIAHLITPLLLGPANTDLSWNTWRNPRNIYMTYNDSNKSMTISGLYEYMFRSFYVTFIKENKTDNKEDLDFLETVYNIEEENYSNKYTGYFKDKNVIFLQLEGIDKWLLNENDTPTLYSMLDNSFVFNKHYSFYNGGGSTFNSEFAVNTGFVTPISYNQNAYTFNKNTFNYSLAKLFKQRQYLVNAFHMNTSEYYSRGTNYHNWGYNKYYGLKDLGTYKDNTYELDRELILNETFNKMIVPEEGKFLDYIISYSTHTPFNSEKGVCHQLLKIDATNDLSEEDILNNNYEIPILSEEDCARRQAQETDYMVSLLLNHLEENGVLDNTVIAVYADHYLYTLNDQTILDKYKETSNNLINNTPFFIWSKGMKRKNINEVTSQLNILPTMLNLFGMEYHPNYYIGEDALNPEYKGYVFFNDYSWYDGNVYVDGGEITNGKDMDQIDLEEKNYYINHIIKKNDLTLKYNYFKKLKNINNNNT